MSWPSQIRPDLDTDLCVSFLAWAKPLGGFNDPMASYVCARIKAEVDAAEAQVPLFDPVPGRVDGVTSEREWGP